MIRKVETLKSIDELNMSSRTRTYFEKKGISLDELVSTGRRLALYFDKCPKEAKKAPKWQIELVSALEEAGFIRHDLYPRTWPLYVFYIAVLCPGLSYSNYTLPPLLTDSNEFFSTENYESMPVIRNEDVEGVIGVLNTLTERERKILTLRFGLLDGKPKRLEEIGAMFYSTRERIRQIEARGLRIMRHPSRIYELPPLFGFVPPEKPEPPKNCYISPEGRKVVYIDSHIDALGLTVRSHNFLLRANICTIEDVLKLPKEDWPKIKNIGHKAMAEIQEKIREAGYPDFTILS